MLDITFLNKILPEAFGINLLRRMMNYEMDCLQSKEHE